MLDNTEDSPKRRSTFYVSLDGEPRQNASKLVKTLSNADSEKFTCNTFPISTAKNPPSAILTRTLSNNETFVGKQARNNPQRSMSIDNSGVDGAGDTTLPVEPRGKVQSLTRIFEAPARIRESGHETSSTESQQTRKKVERTRSFKTIERFQSRFTGRKEIGRSNGKEVTSGVGNQRLNSTIGCLEAGREESIADRRRKKEELKDLVSSDTNKDGGASKIFKESSENKKIDAKTRKFGKDSRDINPRNSTSLVTSQNNNHSNDTSVRRIKQNNNNVGGVSCSVNNSSSKIGENHSLGSSSSSTTFTNLLIRRTHSTKVARSASTLVRSGATNPNKRHVLSSSVSVDNSAANDRQIIVSSINSVDCCNDKDYTCSSNERCPRHEISGVHNTEDFCGGNESSSAFEDPDGDAGVHSGRIAFSFYFVLHESYTLHPRHRHIQ